MAVLQSIPNADVIVPCIRRLDRELMLRPEPVCEPHVPWQFRMIAASAARIDVLPYSKMLITAPRMLRCFDGRPCQEISDFEHCAHGR